MENNRQLAKKEQQKRLREVKNLLKATAVKSRFHDILGKKAPQFTASLVNVVAGSGQLLQCDPNSIMAAAFVAATYDLPIDSNLGFCAIVPYKGKAQFQMMTKGFVQLAIRSREVEKMNCAEVYGDELVDYNPITGECAFVTDFSQCTQRKNGDKDKIIGYYAWFRMLHGYTAELYMSREEMDRHARKYSKAYQYDLNNGRNSSVWTTNFDAMARKTVLKLLLSKWALLSIDLQRAIEDDQKVYDASGEGAYADNEIITAEDPFQAEGAVVEDAVDMEESGESVPQSGELPEGFGDEEPEELDIFNV